MAEELTETEHFRIVDLGKEGEPHVVLLDKGKGVWVHSTTDEDEVGYMAAMIYIAEQAYCLGSHRRDEELKERFFG